MLDQSDLLDLEESIIHACLYDKDAFHYASEQMAVSDFSGEFSKEVFGIMLQLYRNNEEPELLNVVEQVGPSHRDHIYELKDRHVTTAKIRPACKKLKEYSDYRRISKKLSAIQSQTLKTPSELRMNLEMLLESSQSTNGKYDIVNLHEVGLDILDRLKSMGEIVGFSWGLPSLDYYTGGIELGKTYVIGATKKTGKSRFVINTIHELFRQDVKTLFLSLEMSAPEVVKNLISRFGNVSTDAFKRTGVYSEEELHRMILEAMDTMTDKNLIHAYTKPWMSFIEIKNHIRRLVSKGVKVVFIDYLQRMNIQNDGDTRATAIQKTTAMIADCAKEFDVAIIFLSQLANRAEGQMATVGDLKESGGIAENVDCILILNNLDRIEGRVGKGRTNETKIYIEQRSGESAIVNCRTELQYNQYQEMTKDEVEHSSQ
jgi:replicative DNA helicase